MIVAPLSDAISPLVKWKSGMDIWRVAFATSATNCKRRVSPSTPMIIYFCSDCGAYSVGPASNCEECQAELPDDNWTEINDEEFQQLEYIEEFDLPPGLPTWEYDVIRLKSDAEAGGLDYTSELLNRMGERGWELVSIVPFADKDGPRYGVFKRSWISDYDE